MEGVRNLAWLTGILHDCGKYGPLFQEYMEDILKRGDAAPRRHVDHSTAGGRMIEKMAPGRLAAEMIAAAVYSHHGLMDCLDPEGYTLEERRDGKELDTGTVEERFFRFQDKSALRERLNAAVGEVKELQSQIFRVIGRDKDSVYGLKNFYLGMYERLLLSLLIDGDWSDTADFSGRRASGVRAVREESGKPWEQAVAYFEKYLAEMTEKNGGRPQSSLNVYRQEISDACKLAA